MSNTTQKQIDKNLPNKLTILRIILVPIFIIVLWLPVMTQGAVSDLTAKIISAVIFIVSAVTDFVDGKLARKYNLVSNFGKFMDPLADKFLVIGAMLAMALVYDGAMRTGLIISLMVTVFRELAVSSVRLIAKNADGVVIAAAMPGKIKTFSQCIFVPLALLENYIFAAVPSLANGMYLSWICMAVMVFFTIYSGVQYLNTYKDYIK
jgi:CDP-diacylglycerol--glycerol-3-phosphate 3-phosphatidyltransferase